MEKRYKKGIHIGTAIEQKIRERGMTYAEFARRLNVDRTTVYNIVRGNSIDTERLMRISKILEYDFIKEFYETDERDFVEINLPDEIVEQLQKQKIEKITIRINVRQPSAKEPD